MMSRFSFAVQIWPLREAFSKDMPSTLRRVAEIGFEGVELCRWFDWTDMFDKWDAAAIRKVCDEVGLKVVSSHVPYYMIQPDKLETLVEFNKTVGARYSIVASLPEEVMKTKESILGTTNQFNHAAAFLKSADMRIGYHNHARDFHPIDDEIPWDIFMDNTDSEVVMQLDIGHALRGGVDPYFYLEKYPGRAKLLHLKDYSPTKGDLYALGEGDINWVHIFQLSEKHQKPDWYIVEQESKTTTPFEIARNSLAFLQSLEI